MPKMTSDEQAKRIRESNLKQYLDLCGMLWTELNLALDADQRGKVGVTASVSDGKIRTRHRFVDVAEHEK